MEMLLSILGSFLLPDIAVAQGGWELRDTGSAVPGLNIMWQIICQAMPFCDIPALASPIVFSMKVASFIFSIIGGAAVLVIIYGGLKLMTSGEEGMADAKKAITWGVGGVALAILGYSIIIYFVSTVIQQGFT